MRWSSALQHAVYTALSGNITGTVHDEVPPGTAPPYTVIGDVTEVPDDTHTSLGSEETVTIHVFHSAKDSTAVKEVMAEIDVLLHHQTLALSTGTLRLLRREFSEVFRDQTEKPGERWRHGVMRYRATITEA